jgi:hypothetical protein
LEDPLFCTKLPESPWGEEWIGAAAFGGGVEVVGIGVESSYTNEESLKFALRYE